MKKLLFYGHGGAYNHGAEAIVRSSVPFFAQPGIPTLLSTHFPKQDAAFGLDKVVDRLIPADLSLVEQEKTAVSFEEKERIAGQIYRDALKEIDGETVCVAIGGDNYCYPNWHRQSVFHRTAKERGAKSILWGCSIQPEMIDERMAGLLREHDHIYARESVTARALRELGIDQMTQMSDPAFHLLPEPAPLPERFGAHTIALNVSPLALRRFPALLDYFVKTAKWLLTKADALLFLPHVLAPADNDTEALKELERRLPVSLRSRICWAEDDLNAAQRKYLISRCEMLVCCRTHASIAGYSTGVPTLVVGYSVKSEGIALDLGMERWVVDVSKSASLPALVKELWAKRKDVRRTLSAKHPSGCIA